MKRHIVRVFAVTAAVMFMSMTVLELSAQARAGGGRSLGSRGSHSYASPASPSAPQSPSRQYAPAPGPLQQQAGGGFARGLAGGMMGGMLGSMLFGGVAGAEGGNSGAGGGIGLFEIILLVGAGYFIFRYIRKKREADSSSPWGRS